MIFSKKFLLLITFVILLLGIGNVFANDWEDVNTTQTIDNPSIEINSQENIGDDSLLQISSDESVFGEESGEIEVSDWEEIQYYSSLTDQNYVLKLKENTNYYPSDVSDSNYQIVFRNNVTIMGAPGSYIGDSSPNARSINYLAMNVPNNSGIGIVLKGVTFKWISTSYQTDAIFLQMSGNTNNYIENCIFTNSTTTFGHSSLVHIRNGKVTLTNCTFTNITTDFGCLSVYNPEDDATGTCTGASMEVNDCYFEGNYARTEPGCINNCGILVVNNSTFYKNTAFWWAGAIHTHGGANTTIYDSNFTDNIAGWNGGALYTYSYLNIYNTIFIGNNCTTNNGGGAIGACKYLHAPYIHIEDSLFKDNENLCWALDELSTSGTGRGGAISIMDEGLLEVLNTTFIKNAASIGTAICAINGGTIQGSPDIILIGNKFINHTKFGDVLVIKLASSSNLVLEDNYYLNNSFEFKKLRLISGDKVGDEIPITIDAELTNPNSFDEDILDKSEYYIYVDGVYNKTVVGRSFSLNLKNGQTCNIYAVPSISNSRTNEIFVGLPKEYIYVSQKSGNDNNNGSKSSPVSTITKAVEIAKSKGNIIILDGTFSENNLNINYNLSISSVGNIKFTGNTKNSIFNVLNNSNLELENITFDGISFSSSSNSIIKNTEGYTVITNCNFNNNKLSSGTGFNLIEVKNIEVYNSNFTNHNSKTTTMINSDEFLIDNCIFENNIATSTKYNSLIATSGEKTGVKGTVINSKFENNNVKNGCINFGADSNALTIDNTSFIGNSVGSTSDRASAIYIQNSPTVRITSSKFINNKNTGTNAAVIFATGSVSSIYVSDSIILNNTIENRNGMVFSASNLKVYKNLNGNWFGNTLENINETPNVYADACNNWLFLNTSANATILAINQKASIHFDLNNAVDKDGNISFWDAGKIPEIILSISTTDGEIQDKTLNLVNGACNTVFTSQDMSGGIVTATYYNIKSTIDFTWGLITPEIIIDAENITYGEKAVINVNLLSDVDESKVILIFGEKEYDIKNNITIENLTAGKYIIKLIYGGDDKYLPINITKEFEVQKNKLQLTVDVNDAFYGEKINVNVKTNPQINGEISITAGEKTDTVNMINGECNLTLFDLKSGDYTVIAQFSGNENYLPANTSTNFTVRKYQSKINISYESVELGSDVTLTVTVNDDATGNISIKINNDIYTINIQNGKGTYTINNIQRGLYNIEALYDGDVKYASSNATTQFDVARLNTDLNINAQNITYGDIASIEITLERDATGNITLNVDEKNYTSKLTDGKTTFSISGLTAGVKNIKVTYVGDAKYSPTDKTETFSIDKAKSTLILNVSDIKEGQIANIKITINNGATGLLTITSPSGSLNSTIPRTGLVSREISDLKVGQYEISVNYSGDNNYLSSEITKTFKVTSWQTPQWPNEGFDIKNTGKSPYDSNTNGEIFWFKNFDDEIIGNIVIDAQGNLYVITVKGIYSINTNGETNWVFNSNNVGNNFSGLSVYRDVIISPKSEDKLYLINQTTGKAYSNNIYQASSLYAPVIDENANIYITSEYQYSSNSYSLVIIPYKLWQNGGNPIIINLGNNKPLSSPVILNENTVAIAFEKGLGLIDISSKEIISILSGKTNSIRPVVGSGLVYAILDDSLNAVTPQGNVIWTQKITDGAGNYIVLNEENGLYLINSKGNIYKYDLIDGEEKLITNLKITSGILIDDSGNLFAGDENYFYSFDSEGKLLWKLKIQSKIINNPVMDKNGIIYFISQNNTIYSIKNADLKDPEINITVNDIGYGENATVKITLNDELTGEIVLKINDTVLNQTIIGSILTFTVPDLKSGEYIVKAIYSGDGRFNSNEESKTFKVNAAELQNPNLNANVLNTEYGEDITVEVTLNEGATGDVTLKINNIEFRENIAESKVKFTIPDLNVGKYEAQISYSGDNAFNPDEQKISFKISSKTQIIASNTAIYHNGLFKAKLTDIKGKVLSNKNITLTVDGVSYTETTDENGEIKINLTLNSGKYDVDLKFSGDGEYKSSSNKAVLTVLNSIQANNLVRGYNSGTDFKATFLTNDGNPLANTQITYIVNGVSYNVTTDANGVAVLNNKLSVGSYNIVSVNPVTLEEIASTAKIVKRITGNKDLTMDYLDGSVYKVRIYGDDGKAVGAGQIVKFKANGVSYSVKTDKNGYASLKISLIPKKYTVSATYKGQTVTNKLVVKQVLKVKNVSKKKAKSYKFSATLKTSKGKAIAGKKITFKIKGKTYKAKTNKKGTATVTIKLALKVGKYTIKTTYGKTSINKKLTIKK